MSGWYVQHAAFPRADALSEALWSPTAKRNWQGFLPRLAVQMSRYRHQGIGASDGAFAVDFAPEGGRNAALASGEAKVTLTNQVRYGTIRYTLDGSTPTAASPAYKTPLALHFGQTVQATAFTPEGQVLSGPSGYDFSESALRTRVSQELTACGNGALGLRAPLTADSPAKSPVYNIDIFNSCWIYPEIRRDGVTTISIDMARLARNYGLAGDAFKVITHPRQTPYGELVIYRDICEGAEEARIVLSNPATSPNTATVTANLPPLTGNHALCLMFTAPLDGPYYAIDKITLN
jgi:hexosaminidase